jgi:hypothetical protein
MKIYSEAIHLFTQRCEKYLKEIIQNETSIKLNRSRFEINKYTYPLHIVAFTNMNKIGYFDPHTYQIGINQNLMLEAKTTVIKDILRHEFAHYLTYIKYPEASKAHGEEFKSVCSAYAWDQSISKAHINIDSANNLIEGDLKSEKIITKIKALLKLAQSDNVHEAQLATLKANQLLIKHNIENLDSENTNQTIYVQTVLSVKRKNAKLNAIYDILKHFLVKPILIYGKNQVALEVSGDKSNIELAEYVASFLDNELEFLWKNRDSELKGLKAKNSFFSGIAKGYDEKMQELKGNLQTHEQKALVRIDENLTVNLNTIYKRLSFVSSNRSIDKNAYGQGKKAGKSLTINNVIKNKTKSLLLNWRK